MDVAARPYNVLFLGRRNAARSVIAEALMNYWGGGKFRGFSAGSHPQGLVHPIALQLLTQKGLPIEGLRSKSWEEFSAPRAARLDFVFTLYDATDYSCPYWPGQPPNTSWEIANPAAHQESEGDKWLACRAAFRALETRIKILVSLPRTALDRIRLQPGPRVDLALTGPAPTLRVSPFMTTPPAQFSARTRSS